MTASNDRRSPVSPIAPWPTLLAGRWEGIERPYDIKAVARLRPSIRVAHTLDEWSQAIQDCLAPAACAVEQVEARRCVARQHDWDRLVGLLAQSLCSRLGPAYLERFTERCETILPNAYTALSSDR